MVRAFSAR